MAELKRRRAKKGPYPILEKLGERIRTRRKAVGMTQQDVADALGRTRAWVCLLETGRKHPHVGLLAQLATILQTTYGALLAPREPEWDQLPPDEKKLIRLYRRATQANKRKVLQDLQKE